MTKQLINRGTVANDGTGDDLRTAGGKINDNFDEVYTALGNGSSILFDTTGVSDGKGLIYDSSVNKFIVSDFNTFSFTVRDDSSTTSSITSGEILTFSGGTGIDAVVTDDTVTLDIDSTVTTLTGSQVLTNKSIAASSNTITGLTNTNLSGTAGITNANLANSSITIRDDSSTEDAVNLGETLIVTGGTGITSSIATNTLTLNIDSTVATLTGSQVLQNKTIDTANNTITVSEADISDLGSYITASSSDALTNKTFDANGTGNSLSNVEVADLASSAVVIESEGISSNDNDTTLPTSAAVKDFVDTAIAGVGGGKVLQVVVGTDSTIRSTSSTSYVTAGNTLSATITPSSTSNKILCIITCGTLQSNRAFDYTIARNGTRLTGDGNNGLYSREESRGEHISIMYYDSPSSTSSLTYQLYIRENSNIGDGTGYINTNDGSLNVEGRCIVMEIDGT